MLSKDLVNDAAGSTLGEMELLNGVRRTLVAKIVSPSEHDAILRQINQEQVTMFCRKLREHRDLRARKKGGPIKD